MRSVRTLISSDWLDRIGVSAGLLCAVHCLALPLVIAALPLAGLDLLLGERVEQSFAAASVTVGGLSLVPGFLLVHRRPLPLCLLALGASLLLAGRALIGEGSRMEPMVVVVGALALVVAHVTNARFCAICRACRETR